MFKIYLSIILFAIQSTFALAQMNELLPIADSLNIIQMPGGESPQTTRFYSKLDSVVLNETGRVNILHIGGSHVQADIYTNEIRQNIDSLNGALRPPRGLIFPFTAAKTNNPSNYRVSYTGSWVPARNAKRQFQSPLGLTGIMVSTSDTAASITIKLNANDSIARWSTTKLYVIGNSENGNCHPVILCDSAALQPNKTKLGYVFNLPYTAVAFTMALEFDNKNTPDTFHLRGFIADNDEPGIVYHSVGVNGASVQSYLECEYFDSELELIKPDLVVFAIGINDALVPNFTDELFCYNYNKLISRIRAVAPDCALMFITNNDSFKKVRRRRIVNANGLIAQQGFRHLATSWQGGLWDMFEIMGGLKSMDRWHKAGFARADKVHFNRMGYTVIGQLFFNAFLNNYLEYDYYNAD